MDTTGMVIIGAGVTGRSLADRIPTPSLRSAQCCGNPPVCSSILSLCCQL